MLLLTEKELVRSMTEQTERSAAVIGQLDLSGEDTDIAAVIASSLLNTFDSALVVLALEDTANDRDECYRRAGKLVLASPAVSSEVKGFIRQINSFRTEMLSATDSTDNIGLDRCLELLNSYDCFMYQFFQSSATVKQMKKSGELGTGFVSFRNMLDRLIKKSAVSSAVSSSGGTDYGDKLSTVIALLERIAEDNAKLHKKIDELGDRLERAVRSKGAVSDE